VEQELDTKRQLSALIANPGITSGSDAVMLKDFTAKYPYFQPLHLLKAKALSENNANLQELATAALYTNGQLLHHVLHSPELLLHKEFQLISYKNDTALAGEPDALEESGIEEIPQDETPELATEEEVFDEISEVNIDEYRTDIYKSLIEEYQEPADEGTLQLSHEELDKKFETIRPGGEETRGIESLEDDLVLEHIVSADFFAFQDNFKVEDVMEEPVSEPEEQVISKYDDDRLPYTFLWWLAKTRKEHQQIFQPYASPKGSAPANHPPARPNSGRGSSELQQQYVENIFHIQSVFGEENEEYVPTSFKRNSKGDEIIESFIKNEPQISPPKAEQINTENKARKSAEDHSDLVSETLAKIYIEQMLYDKAIETYEKLSLMFPEKSRYFADLVQSIEKKI